MAMILKKKEEEVSSPLSNAVLTLSSGIVAKWRKWRGDRRKRRSSTARRRKKRSGMSTRAVGA